MLSKSGPAAPGGNIDLREAFAQKTKCFCSMFFHCQHGVAVVVVYFVARCFIFSLSLSFCVVCLGCLVSRGVFVVGVVRFPRVHVSRVFLLLFP